MKKMKVIAIFLFFGILAGASPSSAANQAGNLLNQFLTGQEGIQQAYSALQQLINQTVVDSQGQNVGQVKNIVIGQSGAIDYLIVSQGYQLGTGGGGGTLVPIPWNVANPTYRNGRVHINVSRQALQNAPNFSADQWPNFASRNVENRVRGYYGSGGQQRNLNQNYGNQGSLNQGYGNQGNLNR